MEASACPLSFWAEGYGFPEPDLFIVAISNGRGTTLHALLLRICTSLASKLEPYRFDLVFEFFDPAASPILNLRGTYKVILTEQDESALRAFQIPVPLDLSLADQARVLVRFRLLTGALSAFPFKAAPVSMGQLGLNCATLSPSWLLQSPGAVEEIEARCSRIKSAVQARADQYGLTVQFVDINGSELEDFSIPLNDIYILSYFDGEDDGVARVKHNVFMNDPLHAVKVRDNNLTRADDLQLKVDEQSQYIDTTFSDLRRSFPELTAGFNDPILATRKNGTIVRVLLERTDPDSPKQIVYRKSTTLGEFRKNPASVFLVPIHGRPLLQIDVFSLLLSWSMNAVNHSHRRSVCALPDGITQELQQVLHVFGTDSGYLLSLLTNTLAHDDVCPTFLSAYPILSALLAPNYVHVVLDTGTSFQVPFTYKTVFSETVEDDVTQFIDRKALHMEHENGTVVSPPPGYTLSSAEFLLPAFYGAVDQKLVRSAAYENNFVTIETITNLWCCNDPTIKEYGFLVGGFMYMHMDLQLFTLNEIRGPAMESIIANMMSESNMADHLEANTSIAATHATSPEAMAIITSPDSGLNSSPKMPGSKWKQAYMHTGACPVQQPLPENLTHLEGDSVHRSKQQGVYGICAYNSSHMTKPQSQAEILRRTFSVNGVTAFVNSLHIVTNTVLMRMIRGVGKNSPGVIKTRDYRNLCTGFWAISMKKYFDHNRGFLNHRYSPSEGLLQEMEADIKQSGNTDPCIIASSFAGICKGSRTFGLVWIDKNKNGGDESQKEANWKMMGGSGNKPLAIINTRQRFSRAEKDKALDVHRQVIDLLKPLFRATNLLAEYRDTTRSSYIEAHCTAWSDFLEKELGTSIEAERQLRLQKLRETVLAGEGGAGVGATAVTTASATFLFLSSSVGASGRVAPVCGGGAGSVVKMVA